MKLRRRALWPVWFLVLGAALFYGLLIAPSSLSSVSKWVAVGLLLTATLLGIRWAIYQAVEPIERLSRAARSLTSGAIDRELVVMGDEETRRIGGALNELRTRMMSNSEQTQEQQSILGSVVAGMQGGLLVIDAAGRIVLANRFARSSMNDTGGDVEGRPAQEVIRNPKINEAIEGVLGDPVEQRLKVVGTGVSARTFDVRVTPFALDADPETRGGAIVLLTDVTRLEALETVRQQFVANVSHELRTPLTTVRAAIETLLDGRDDLDESQFRFVEMIQRQSIRMNDLIEDLTDLSLIETGAISFEPTRVKLRERVQRIVDDLKFQSKSKRIEVRVDIAPDISVLSDPRRFDQIMTNLIDNAIKFQQQPGKVVLSASGAGDKVRVSVEDDGPGIPSTDVPKIFQRFHRVEGSRNTETGGTGLGLAIVKHLMTLHGGEIEVNSELGHGSRFVLTFPAADSVPS